MTVYSLYLPGDQLSLQELLAARLDGDVFELGDAFMATDAVEYAAMRAATYAPVAGTHWAVTEICAAWVHGAVPVPPSRVTLQRVSPRRARYISGPRVSYRDSLLAEGDATRMHGVAVTTPARTIADLARASAPEGLEAGRALASIAPGAVDDAMSDVEHASGTPHRRRALTALHAWRTERAVHQAAMRIR